MADEFEGVAGRGELFGALSAALENSKRAGTEVGVLLVGVDYFKNVQDGGEPDPERVPRAAAACMVMALRPRDTVVRYGHSDFFVVLPDTSLLEAVKVAEKIVARVVEHFKRGMDDASPSATPGRPIGPVGVSVGVSCGTGATDGTSLLRLANERMDMATMQGANQIVWQGQRPLPANAIDAESLQQAIERNQFFLLYQPKVCLRTGRVTSAEALLRWDRPGVGELAPDSFLSWVQHAGLMESLDRWVLNEATRQAKVWQESGTPLRVAVNVGQPLVASLLRAIAQVLAKSGLSGEYLDVEFTPDFEVTEGSSSVPCAEKLRELGVGLHLDRFGTGYSSLVWVRNWPLDAVKIHHSFLADVQKSGDILRKLVDILRTLDISSVAVGVESETVDAFLKEIDAGVAQGYFYARPMRSDALKAWINARVALE